MTEAGIITAAIGLLFAAIVLVLRTAPKTPRGRAHDAPPDPPMMKIRHPEDLSVSPELTRPNRDQSRARD
ncbi:MAG: hypothetical protein AAGL89_07170 [Pseudomonadota bacterium]